MRGVLILAPAAMLAGCGASDGDQAALDAAIVAALPPMPAYTAAGVSGCTGSGEETACLSCELVAFGPDRAEGAVEAEMYRYEFGYREGDDSLFVRVQGPAGARAGFEHDGSLEGARGALDAGRDWCESHGAQRWHVGRDMLAAAYERGAP
ncbi:MAG: hypothetical protein KIS81_02255 [Maricaulaceae bacterium]|nr:hypothetical protein [Maricaulaceae bacterium]